MFGRLLKEIASLAQGGDKQGEQAPLQDFGSNAAAQEQLAQGGDHVAGKLTNLQATQGGTQVTVQIGDVPGFNAYWTVIMNGGRTGHYLLDLIEPLPGHGERTPWNYDGNEVQFVVPYSYDQVKSFGREYEFKRGKHLVGSAKKASKDGKTLSETSGRLVGLQQARDGRTKVQVSVREGTDGMGRDWIASLADGRTRIDLREADVSYHGRTATFYVDLTLDQVKSMSREVSFTKA